MTGIVTELLDILDLKSLEPDLFRGESLQTGWFRVFGGQVVAQALVAASRTVPETRPPHSLHAYFLLGGDPAAAIDYAVERIRDGRSFTTRRVVAATPSTTYCCTGLPASAKPRFPTSLPTSWKRASK